MKRLGGPNFTHIPINAPKCPFRHFQQDGHMAMRNPVGRANYEPNSWTGEERGPRESPAAGFKSFSQAEGGEKVRSRSELFGDHYSQARQFFHSQTDVEQEHIVAALVFELSKVKTVAIRERMITHLLNVDTTLADSVAEGLGLQRMPEPATPARKPVAGLASSDALGILNNGPARFSGRKVGVLLSNGASAGLVDQLRKALKSEGAQMAVVALKAGGVVADDGSVIEADEMADGGPSVLFDAIAVITSSKSWSDLGDSPAAREFITDAFQHKKFIAYSESSIALFSTLGWDDTLDEGFVMLANGKDAKAFVARCRALRLWDRSEDGAS